MSPQTDNLSPFSACYFLSVVFLVMHTAYRHKPNFSVLMCLSRQVDSLSIAPEQTMGPNKTRLRIPLVIYLERVNKLLQILHAVVFCHPCHSYLL